MLKEWVRSIAKGEEMLKLAEDAYQAEKRAERYHDVVEMLIALNNAIYQYWMNRNVNPLLEAQQKVQELLERLGEI